jgi:ACT domain-containing protein
MPYRALQRAAKKLSGDKSITIDDICKTLGISRSTYYRYLSLGNGDSKNQSE